MRWLRAMAPVERTAPGTWCAVLGPSLAAVCMLATASRAVELENWRLRGASLLADLGLLHGSPSSMFWDDVYVEDPLLVDHGQWPDTVWRSRGHWHLEPALTGLASNEAYVDGRQAAGRLELTNDIRVRRLFVRQTLDVDSRYKQDPAFVWKKDRAAAGRIEEAGLRLSFDHAGLTIGRLKRSWGPFADRSLVLSVNPHTYDGLEWYARAGFFEFRHLFAAFDQATSWHDTDNGRLWRYLSAHSLNLMLGPWVTLGLTESVVFGRSGLPDFQYVNPVSVYAVSNTNGEADANLMLAAQWRVLSLTRRLELKGQIVLDDIQVDNEDTGDQEPPHWGLDVGVSWYDPLPLGLRNSLVLEYTYLSRWLYLVSRPNTRAGGRYTYLGQSLGHPTNDGDRWRLAYTVLGHNYWLGRIGVAYGRAGGNTVTSDWQSGDTANPDAGYNGYRRETSLRSDTAEHTLEAFVALHAYWRGYVYLTAEVVNRWVRNAGNVRTDAFEYEPIISASISVQFPRFYHEFTNVDERAAHRRRYRERDAAVDEGGGDSTLNRGVEHENEDVPR